MSNIEQPTQDTPWFDADRFTDPRDAPSAFFEEGAYDAQHGVLTPKTVNPLYQANYNEGFAFGQYLLTQLQKETM